MTQLVLVLLHLIGIKLPNDDLFIMLLGAFLIFGLILIPSLLALEKVEKSLFRTVESEHQASDGTEEPQVQKRKPGFQSCLFMLLVVALELYAALAIASRLMQ